MKRSLILVPYHLYSLWNWRNGYLGRLIEPIAYLVFLVAGIGGFLSGKIGFDYLSFAIPGVLCLVAFRSFTLAVADVANDRKWGVFAIFLMQGGTVFGYLASVLIVSSLVYAIQILLVCFFGFLLTVNQGSDFHFLHFFFSSSIALFVSLGWSAIGSAMGAVIQSYASRDLVVTATSLPAILAAPLFYSKDSAPELLQFINSVNPLSYNVEWIRTPGDLALLLSVIWALLAILVAVFCLSHAEKLSTER